MVAEIILGTILTTLWIISGLIHLPLVKSEFRCKWYIITVCVILGPLCIVAYTYLLLAWAIHQDSD